MYYGKNYRNNYRYGKRRGYYSRKRRNFYGAMSSYSGGYGAMKIGGKNTGGQLKGLFYNSLPGLLSAYALYSGMAKPKTIAIGMIAYKMFVGSNSAMGVASFILALEMFKMTNEKKAKEQNVSYQPKPMITAGDENLADMYSGDEIEEYSGEEEEEFSGDYK